MHLQDKDVTISLMQNYTECITYRKANLIVLRGKKIKLHIIPKY